MMQPGWAILLLCLSANADSLSLMIENITLYREFCEDVTLECSSEGCPDSIEEYTGMYLYLRFKEEKEVVLYYFMEMNVNVREQFKNRIQMEGPLRNNTITISNLTVEDAGSYQCVYTHINKKDVPCKVHTLVVRGKLQANYSCLTSCPCGPGVPGPLDAASASGSPRSHTPGGRSLLPAKEVTGQPCISESTMEMQNGSPLVMVTGFTCAISILVIIASILLILRVKRWSRNRRTATAPQAFEDNVYETMNKNSLHPLADPQNPQLN